MLYFTRKLPISSFDIIAKWTKHMMENLSWREIKESLLLDRLRLFPFDFSQRLGIFRERKFSLLRFQNSIPGRSLGGVGLVPTS